MCVAVFADGARIDQYAPAANQRGFMYDFENVILRVRESKLLSPAAIEVGWYSSGRQGSTLLIILSRKSPV